MSMKQIETKAIELIHAEPFVPFAFEMTDGGRIEIRDPWLVINETGAGFISREGALEDVDFAKVRSITLLDKALA